MGPDGELPEAAMEIETLLDATLEGSEAAVEAAVEAVVEGAVEGAVESVSAGELESWPVFDELPEDSSEIEALLQEIPMVLDAMRAPPQRCLILGG